MLGPAFGCWLQVLIKEFAERRGRKDFISADIVVEKESQKGILIGAGGLMLRRIGQEARKEIEVMLERPVYLELSVQVRVCVQGR